MSRSAGSRPRPRPSRRSISRSARPSAPAWLAAQGDPSRWGTLLFWETNAGYLTRISNARAVSRGLTFRSIGTTLADTLNWYEDQPEDARATLNTGFRRDPATGDFVQVRIPWPEYFERERETLAAWHAEQAQ